MVRGGAVGRGRRQGERRARRRDLGPLRASVDDFHHPRAIRYRRGRDSPEGFYLDAFDRDALTSLLLAPFAAGERIRRRAFDHVADAPVGAPVEDAPEDAVLVLDGLFLHRSELRTRWDFSILLDVPPAVAAQRLLRRDGEPPRRRHVGARELYLADADPARYASLVLPW